MMWFIVAILFTIGLLLSTVGNKYPEWHDFIVYVTTALATAGGVFLGAQVSNMETEKNDIKGTALRMHQLVSELDILSVKANFLRDNAASHKGQRISFFGDNHIYYPTTLDLLLAKPEDKARFSLTGLGVIDEHKRQLTDLQKVIDSQAEISDILLGNLEKYLLFLLSLRCVVEIEANKLDGQLSEQSASEMINSYLRGVHSEKKFTGEQLAHQCPRTTNRD